MTISTNSNILASDFNNIVGSNSVTVGYASSVAATNKVAALYGVGYGDRGYGMTSPVLSSEATGNTIVGQDFIDIRSALATMASYQGTPITTLPTAASFAAGAVINSADHTALATFAALIDTNRLNTNSGASLSVTASSLVITRASTWGSSLGGIVCEITASFASENAARYFFNSGGSINTMLNHASVTTVQNSNWGTILAALGTISIKANTTTRSGSGGTPVALGYYGLTAAYQTVFNGTNIGTGSYTANDVLVQALSTNIVGLNGGVGTTIKIKVTLTDQHTNSFSDLVALGSKATFGFTKAAVVLTGIASPTFAAVTNF